MSCSKHIKHYFWNSMELKCFFSRGFTTKWFLFLFPASLHIIVQYRLALSVSDANVNTDHITSGIVSDSNVSDWAVGPHFRYYAMVPCSSVVLIWVCVNIVFIHTLASRTPFHKAVVATTHVTILSTSIHLIWIEMYSAVWKQHLENKLKLL